MSYQNLQVLSALRSGPKTTAQLVMGLRVMSITRRIFELRKTHQITSTEEWRGRTRVVTYCLVDA